MSRILNYSLITAISRFTRNFFQRIGARFLSRMILAILFSIFALLKQPWWTSPKSINDSKRYKVVSISDGDTLIARIGANSIHIRLIGIDAPEYHKNEKALLDSQRSGVSLKKILAMGESSYQHLNQLVPIGSEVKLTEDRVKLDRFGRSLSYVYLVDGTFINKVMVEDGYANEHAVTPNIQFKSEFSRAASKARRNRAGLWAQFDLDRFKKLRAN